MNTPTRFPLSWPDRWPRARYRSRSSFHNPDRRFHGMTRVIDDLFRQLSLLKADRPLLSSNIKLRLDGLPYADQPLAKDPGAAVYCHLKGRPISLACDKWDRVECNIWAIAKHIEALRGQERWGIGTVEQAFTGYMQLPAPMVIKPWYVVLGVVPSGDRDFIQQRYRDLAKINHPDAGGDVAIMAEINAAWDECKKERGW